jgi:hypothetical protein
MEAAHSKAFLLAEVTDCTTWVRNVHDLPNGNLADSGRLDNTMRHCNHRLAVPALEIGKKEGCCRTKVRDSITPTKNAVLIGNREMQLFLFGYIVVSICEIFTIGGFPLNDSVRLVCYSLRAPVMHGLTVL